MTTPEQAPLSGGITVRLAQGDREIPISPGDSLLKTLFDAGFPVGADCGGRSVCGKCRVRVEGADSIPLTESETRLLTPEQIENGIRLACQITPLANLRVDLQSGNNHHTWRPLRDDEYISTLPPQFHPPKQDGLGVCLDIGTTHIRITLWNLKYGRRLCGRTSLNPQIAYGSDILTRLTMAVRSPAMAERLKTPVIDGIGEAILEMTAESATSAGQITIGIIVGNTAMLTLLAEKNYWMLLDPDHWSDVIDYRPDNIGILRKAWRLAEDARIELLPSMGGFVGSDLLAGVIATGLMEKPAGSLLIDFGTNSEMALWDGEALHVTSTAGGPAFEGSGISHGMPSENGAIYGVAASDTAPRAFTLSIVGDGPPKGICGAGLVDIIACLRRNGALDRIGRYQEPGIREIVISDTDNRIILTSQDIDVFQRAKAAIGAGVSWLCDRAQIPLEQLQRLYVSGAFGLLLNVENAKEVGILPPLPETLIELLSNTALAGSELVLLSDESADLIPSIKSRTKVYNMAEDQKFETLFIQNLYIQPMQD